MDKPVIASRIQVMRLFLCIMVVYIHSTALPRLEYDLIVPPYIEVLKNILGAGGLCSIAVPGFYFLAGYFFYKDRIDWKIFYKSKAIRVLLPFVAINLFWVIFFKVMQSMPVVSHYFMSDLYRVESVKDFLGAIFSSSPMYYPFWYLYYLIIYFMIAPIICIILKKIPHYFLVLILVLWFSDIVQIPYIHLESFVLFYIGAYCKSLNIELDNIDKIPILVYGILFFVGVAVLVTYKHILWIHNVEIIAGICFAFSVTRYFETSTLIKWGDYSFFVYCTHEFGEAFSKSIVMRVLPQWGIVQLSELILIPIIWVAFLLFVAGIVDKSLNNEFFRAIVGLKKN